MDKFAVQMALEGYAEARKKWRDARRVFERDSGKVLNRLIYEAAANYMSVRDISLYAGITPATVRDCMSVLGMDGTMRKSKRLLADHAAKALAENSDLLGMAPHEMDLTSPLAYLPAGSELRQKITDATTAGVTEFPETEEERAVRVALSVRCRWCGAKPASECTTGGHGPHPSRINAARIVIEGLLNGAAL